MTQIAPTEPDGIIDAGTISDAEISSGESEPVRKRRQATRGQILILAAGALVALVGMVGMATDYGYVLAERRTMQNAADAGALAGARKISKWSATSTFSVLSDVTSAATANKLSSTPSIVSCTYVDDSDVSLGSCSTTVPVTATGVHVVVKETHNTFFMGAIPGGPGTLTTRASATAHVQFLKTPPGDGPFLVCGVGTKLDSGGVTGSSLGVLISADGDWVINPKAVNSSDNNFPKYQIYGPQVATCNISNSSYKGLALGSTNKTLPIPGWFYYTTGDAAGNLGVTAVPGVNGCNPSNIVNCVAFLPVAVNSPVDSTGQNRMWTVVILPFFITGTPNGNGTYNSLDGQLMGDYITLGQGQVGWIPGSESPIIIRLTK